MDVLIVTTLKTSAPSIDIVADAIKKAIDKVLDNANFLAKTKNHKINTILTFEAIEINSSTAIERKFIFPNDLDQIKPTNT